MLGRFLRIARSFRPTKMAATGLAWFSLQVAKPDLFASLEQRFHRAGAKVAALADGIETVDPWGTRVRLVRA
jgi:catechol 2,3-dioxygenase